jgi:hypothetical protein
VQVGESSIHAVLPPPDAGDAGFCADKGTDTPKTV